MKNKLKFFIMTAMVMFGILLVPNIYAAEMFENGSGRTPTNSDVVCSFNANKTEVTAGDIIDVTITLDKLPDNGLGVCAFSSRIAFDPTKVEVLECGKDGVEGTGYKYIMPGEAGRKLGLNFGSAGIINAPGDDNMKMLSMGCFGDSSDGVKDPGVVATIKFKVKEGAKGNLGLFLLKDDATNNGFSVAGAYINDLGEIRVDSFVTYYVNSNLSQVKAI